MHAVRVRASEDRGELATGGRALPERAIGCRTRDPSSPIQSLILGVAGGKIKVKRPERGSEEEGHVPTSLRTQKLSSQD